MAEVGTALTKLRAAVIATLAVLLCGVLEKITSIISGNFATY
jgi:hypothetical protein